jgi:ATP-dependent helicase/nuclease subunit A
MRPTKTFQKLNPSQKQALDASRNLAVRASAGSGKTRVLVERIAQLLAQSWDEKKSLEESLQVTQIVAVTFTRKAAAELEERLRETFRAMAKDADAEERAFWARQIDALPRAMIGTIDSFCARILREFGLEDASPDRIEPDFAALEGYEELVLKREAVDRVINELEGMTGNLPASGGRHAPGPSTIQQQIEACRWWSENEGYYWLTEYLVGLLGHAIEPEKIVAAHRDLPSPGDRVQAAWEKLPAIQAWKKDRTTLVNDIQAILRKIQGHDKKKLDDLGERLEQALEAFRRSDPDSICEGLRHLHNALFTQNGDRRKMRGMKEVEDRLVPLQEKWCPLLESFEFDFSGEVRALEAADKLALLLEPAWKQYLTLCREANQYDFWTIARKTRDLLARDAKVCRDLKERYRYVMVDEFQDTNQLQWDIISWVVGSGPEGPLDSDRLFVVGDPQQSIYRFRKADVSVFSRVQEKIQERTAATARIKSRCLWIGRSPPVRTLWGSGLASSRCTRTIVPFRPCRFF